MSQSVDSKGRRWSLAMLVFIGVTLFSIFGTILVLKTQLKPGPMPMIGSLVMIGSGSIVIFQSLTNKWLGLAVLVIGATFELIGLYSEWPFGHYVYTSEWSPVVPISFKGLGDASMNFPIQLPFAWLMVVGGAFSSLRRRFQSRLVLIVGTAALATVIDFFMEFAMTQVLRYWVWVEPGPLPGGAPVANSVGWFLVSAFAATVLSMDKPLKAPAKRDPGLMLTLYCAFITILVALRFFIR